MGKNNNNAKKKKKTIVTDTFWSNENVVLLSVLFTEFYKYKAILLVLNTKSLFIYFFISLAMVTKFVKNCLFRLSA